MNLIEPTIEHQKREVNALGCWGFRNRSHVGQGQGLFFRSKAASGGLVSRPAHFKELRTGDARPLRLRLAIRRAVPPPSLFPSRSLGAIGSPIP